jgi:branched-chain amino acid aminotransferase
MGNDRPGPLSLRLKDLYWRKHREGWHRTPVRHESTAAAAQ